MFFLANIVSKAMLIKPIGIWMLANVVGIILVVHHGQANSTAVKLNILLLKDFFVKIE
jgi:hypothetical protein